MIIIIINTKEIKNRRQNTTVIRNAVVTETVMVNNYGIWYQIKNMIIILYQYILMTN